MYDVTTPLVVGSFLSAVYNCPPTSNLASSDSLGLPFVFSPSTVPYITVPIAVSLLLVCVTSVYFVFFLLCVSGICLLQLLPALLRLLYVQLIFSIILYDRTSKASIHFVSSYSRSTSLIHTAPL